MTVDSERDLEQLRLIGRIVALALQAMIEKLEPGITTRELDAAAKAVLQEHGAHSAPEMVYKFPGATCISVNTAAAHGIPNERVIQPGDVVNLDVSAELDGYFADTGATLPVPPVTAEVERLCKCTRQALTNAIQAVRAGRRLNVIGKAVELQAKRCGYNVIRPLQGHGIGHALHEDPRNVRNYFYRRDKRILHEGLVIAIEPFLTVGEGNVFEDSDGWTLRTVEGTIPAQYEHTIVVTNGEPIILTTVE